MESEFILQCEEVSKVFRSGNRDITVLSEVDLKLKQGETCAVLGPSGSGKTTLLTLAAGLDRPSGGRITLAGKELSKKSEDELAVLRGEAVGFVFQNYQLIPSLTALENVLVPVQLREAELEDDAARLLDRVGLSSRTNHYPSQLSGGEQQRVSLARAFINRPMILFADEPTGSLDRDNARRALELMFELNSEYRASMLLVTHDPELGKNMQRRIFLKDGQIAEET